MDSSDFDSVDQVVDGGFSEFDTQSEVTPLEVVPQEYEVEEYGVIEVDQGDSTQYELQPVSQFVEVVASDGKIGRYNVTATTQEDAPDYEAMLADLQNAQLGTGLLLTALVGMLLGFLSSKELLQIWMHY